MIAALDRLLAATCRWIVIGCLLGLFALLTLGIVQRSLPLFTITGYDELIELLFGWMVFVGALALWREGALYRVDMLERALPRRPRLALAALIHLAMLAVAAMLALKGWDFLRMAGETTPYLQIDKSYWYAAIPICGAIAALYSLAALWRTLRGDIGEGAEVTTLG
jgi:TRAP-type C4-dicarboxylate transport system permease small subunit